MPEHGNRHFTGEVIAFRRSEKFARLIGDGQLVNKRIELEQATVVRRNVAFRQAFVDRAEKPLIVHPQWLLDPAAIMVNAFERVFFEWSASFREGDEQKPVEQLLCGGDKARRFVIVTLRERKDKLRAPRFVILVEHGRDFTLLLTRLNEQLCSVAP